MKDEHGSRAGDVLSRDMSPIAAPALRRYSKPQTASIATTRHNAVVKI